MNGLISLYEANKIKKDLPDFRVGDTIKLSITIKEGEKTRIQAFEGICIAKSGIGTGKRITVRKRSSGFGVEKIFPLYSPLISKIEVIKKGKVRRAKLFYIRNLKGKSERIKPRD